MTRGARAVLEPGSKRIPSRPRDERGGAWKVCAVWKLGGPRFTLCTFFDLRGRCKYTEWSARILPQKREVMRTQGRWSQRVEFSADVRLEVSREGSRPPGECGAAPGVATRDSSRNGGVHGSAPACCRCDARVRPQQRGCGVPYIALRQVQRSPAKLQQRGGAWSRQADP